LTIGEDFKPQKDTVQLQ